MNDNLLLVFINDQSDEFLKILRSKKFLSFEEQDAMIHALVDIAENL